MKKKKVLKLGLGFLTVFAAAEIIAVVIAWPQKTGEAALAGQGSQGQPSPGRLKTENASLARRLQGMPPKGIHIVVDSAHNVLYLKKGKEILRQAVISCGSGSILEEPGGKRTWVFDTPRGEFQVKSKLVEPTWVKPDWAFIEEGKEVPKNPEERLEPGVLGDFALGFGSGYFIHGTLYTRMLGRSVTHGCIRVGDDDLKAIFSVASIGTKIYIY
jgi:lipoprotein-anchoring transpeptidase ErfK/SrfK